MHRAREAGFTFNELLVAMGLVVVFVMGSSLSSISLFAGKSSAITRRWRFIWRKTRLKNSRRAGRWPMGIPVRPVAITVYRQPAA